MYRFALSLGSNSLPLSSRLRYIESAVCSIELRLGPVIATSGLYETITAYVENAAVPQSSKSGEDYHKTKPTQAEPIPPHLNAVLLVESTIGEPEKVLRELQGIERDLGRDRSVLSVQPYKYSDQHPYNPAKREFHKIRPIDIDFLLSDDRIYNSEFLTLPHPGLTQRNFILFPLKDASPGMRIPNPGVGEINGTPVEVFIERNLSRCKGSCDALNCRPTL